MGPKTDKSAQGGPRPKITRLSGKKLSAIPNNSLDFLYISIFIFLGVILSRYSLYVHILLII